MLETLPVFKVRPASDHGPSKLETGMPNFEAIAGIEAAARFLIEEGMEQLAAAEAAVFTLLLEGLQSINGVTVWGSQTLEGRVPTAAFTIAGVDPAEASKALAAAKVAVWDGHNYAVEVVEQLGLADSGGVIRRHLPLRDASMSTACSPPSKNWPGSIPGPGCGAVGSAPALGAGVGSSSLPIPTNAAR